MKTIQTSLDVRFPIQHIELIRKLSFFFELEPGDTLDLSMQFSDTGFVFSDNLLLIATLIDHLKAKGVTVNINIAGSNPYAARVNFFNLLDVPIEETFVRQNSIGRFIEIKSFDPDTMYALQDELNLILYQIVGISKEVLQLLFYCLGEIIDNTIVHSGLHKGWVSAQYFPKNREIRLLICDNGKGIHQSLSANAKYANIDEKNALGLSIERGVTDGEGLGFGLYATSQFILHNQGDMLLYSGGHYLRQEEGGYKVHTGEHWQGTVVYLKINTDIAVDYKQIMPTHHTLPDDYDFFIEKFFGEDNELW